MAAKRPLTDAEKARNREIYAARIARNLAKGQTRQQARGKGSGSEYAVRKAREAERKAREAQAAAERATAERRAKARAARERSDAKARQFGFLTRSEKARVRAFCKRQAARSDPIDDPDAEKDFTDLIVNWVQGTGMDAFDRVKSLQAALRAEYMADRKAGIYIMRPGLLEQLALRDDIPDTRLLFYH